LSKIVETSLPVEENAWLVVAAEKVVAR